MKRAAIALTVTLVTIVGATGCGGVTSGSGGSRSVSDIKKAGVLRIGIAVNPLAYRTPSGDWQGFMPEVDRQFAKSLGVKAQFVATGFQTIVAGLQANKYDMIGSDLHATPERKKVVTFAAPIHYSGTAYYVPTDNPKHLRTLADLDKPDVKIGMLTGSDNQLTTQKELPHATIVALPNGGLGDNILQVTSKKTDAMATSSFLTAALTAKYPWTAIPGAARQPNGLGSVGQAWALRKSDTQLLSAANGFVARMRSDGQLKRLEDKYFKAARLTAG